MKPNAAIAIATLLTGAAPLAALAQGEPGHSPFSATTLSLSAYGEVSLPPDMATLNIGVQTTAPTAAEASRTNAQQMSQVVASLKSSGVAAADLRTEQLGLSPQYVYEANHPPKLTGYQASNQVTVEVRDLARVGRTIDAAVESGATNLGQVNLGLANPVSAENSARVAAVKALEDKAALYAQATGYRIVRLVNLTEGGAVTPIRPMPMALMAKAQSDAETPVEGGEVKVRVDITGVFELSK